MKEQDEIVTTDLTRFGWRERKIACDLLQAWNKDGLPEDFDEGEGARLYFNTASGFVFLSSEEGSVAMMNVDKLESFYSCPECGFEGFREDFERDHKDAADPECQRFLRQIGVLPEEEESEDETA